MPQLLNTVYWLFFERWRGSSLAKLADSNSSTALSACTQSPVPSALSAWMKACLTCQVVCCIVFRNCMACTPATGRPAQLGHWLGFRECDFAATIELREKKVQNLDIGSSWMMARTNEDESPEYSVRRYFKWPELELSISFTPRARATLSHHAFEPSLNCIWILRGCRTTEQILPRAWQDEENIQHAVDVRLHSSNPCPDRILPPRARDT